MLWVCRLDDINIHIIHIYTYQYIYMCIHIYLRCREWVCKVWGVGVLDDSERDAIKGIRAAKPTHTSLAMLTDSYVKYWTIAQETRQKSAIGHVTARMAI